MIQLALQPRSFRFRTPAATSRGALHERTVLLVAATDPARPGRTGLGECGPIPGLSADATPDWQPRAAELAAAIAAAGLELGDHDGDPLPAVTAALAPFAHQLAAAPSLRFALETALCGLLGDANGRTWPSAFTRGAAPLPTHGLLWMDSAEGLLQQAADKVSQGFTVLKFKVGALPFAEELAMIEALRTRYPHVGLRADANGALALDSAAAQLEALAGFDLEFVEQPVPPVHGDALLALSRMARVPLGVDESLIALTQDDRFALLRTLASYARVPPVAILKPALLGGFGPTAALADQCDALGMPWVVNSLLEAAPGHAALCQWTAWRLEQSTGSRAPVQALGTGALFADNLPSPIALRGPALHWLGSA